MAVTPINNALFINQNAQAGSVQHANAQTKLDFQAMVNLQAMQDAQDEIQEVRPTEEIQKTDEDAEGSKQEQEQQESKDKEEEEDKNLPQKDPDIIQKYEDGTIKHLNISI